MKRSTRFTRTLEFLRDNPAQRRFFEQYPVLIYSGEHKAFWRPNASGYTQNLEEAGVYAFKDAFETTKNCDPSKKIKFQIASDENLRVIGKKYARQVHEFLHGQS